ncbi:hypothetical protein CFP71_10045 [Amycolatopsis thailandensis]|uniref:Uncharacterized protein n=1 Tax=Amycolatopsis thailandensis TaxID=589330 RepID=A0A229SDS0_9PSEU|nr:hypothetical protein [Amycolatopsis thailandensis]OXM57067.1 hypothetical protein CFP71_10045 [Amycolatopsis thailandensis]
MAQHHPTTRSDRERNLHTTDTDARRSPHDPSDGTVSATDSLIADGMRWTPASEQERAAVDAVLIPCDLSDPVRLISLKRSEDGTLLAALDPYLGSPVDAGTCLSTVDFLVNDDGHYTDDPDRYDNLRASAFRAGVWKTVIDGTHPASPADVELARGMFEPGPAFLPLFGPVVVVGVDPATGEWRSAPELVVDRILTADANVTRVRALLQGLALRVG